jgi:hypothetical protein
MELDLLDNVHYQKGVFKETPIWTVSLLGGPIAGAYLIVENLKSFQLTQHIRKVWIGCVILVLFDIACIGIHPIAAVAAIFILPFIHMTIAHIVVERLFERLLIEYSKNKREYRASKEAMIVGLIGFFGSVIPLIIAAVLRYLLIV